jgi:hypothetical protein
MSSTPPQAAEGDGYRVAASGRRSNARPRAGATSGGARLAPGSVGRVAMIAGRIGCATRAHGGRTGDKAPTPAAGFHGESTSARSAGTTAAATGGWKASEDDAPGGGPYSPAATTRSSTATIDAQRAATRKRRRAPTKVRSRFEIIGPPTVRRAADRVKMRRAWVPMA